MNAPVEPGVDGASDPSPASRGTQTLMRGLDLVEALRDEPRRVAELARTLGLSRTTTHRLAAALVERGYVAQHERGMLTLGPTLLQLGFSAHRRIDIVRVARSRMEALSADTGLCVFLGRRDGDHSLHLDRAAGRQRLEVSTRPGDRRPVAQTGIGKALLFDENDASSRARQPMSQSLAGSPTCMPMPRADTSSTTAPAMTAFDRSHRRSETSRGASSPRSASPLPRNISPKRRSRQSVPKSRRPH
jgi:DNA-binding IclR family transcriptional regulator